MEALIIQIWEHAKPVEFAQGLLQAGFIWALVRKSMKAELQLFRDEMAEIRKAIAAGFASGEMRFTGLEKRVERLETKNDLT